jgi:mannose-6-phosphate isomerase-like protein (cupin superfamily)
MENNDNWGYLNSYFRYVPYNELFDEMECDSRADMGSKQITLQDYGPEPYAINIDLATKQNNNYRTALWTGTHFQVTLMSIKVGEDIGLEIHPNIDQFIRIEDGEGIVRMGKSKDNLDFQGRIRDGFAIMIPAGTWHNIVNTGNKPLKLYSIYAPPQHPQGVVQVNKTAD